MASSEPWTIGRLLQWTTGYLQQHGSPSARLDAEVLLAFARKCRRIELYTSFEEPASDALRAEFRELVRRRGEGMPVAYLVGHREFYSLEFRVTPDVLIPRPETELLVVRLLDLVKQQPRKDGQPVEIVDVGTGSGVIAITAAKHSDCRITAIDISPVALAVARENAATHGVAERIKFFEGDLLAACEPDQKFDLVVSNPPYVSTAELSTLARDVREFEPELALAAGPNGTSVIERLIPQAAEHLVAGGWFLCEIGPALDARVRELLTADGRFDPAPTIKDLAGLTRVAQAQRH